MRYHRNTSVRSLPFRPFQPSSFSVGQVRIPFPCHLVPFIPMLPEIGICYCCVETASCLPNRHHLEAKNEQRTEENCLKPFHLARFFNARESFPSSSSLKFLESSSSESFSESSPALWFKLWCELFLTYGWDRFQSHESRS